MKVRLQYFSRLKDLVAQAEADQTLAENATVADLLGELYRATPALRDWDGSILVGVGVEFVERDHVLRDGDEVSIMPPVQGG